MTKTVEDNKDYQSMDKTDFLDTISLKEIITQQKEMSF